MISRRTCEFYVLLPLAVSSLEDFRRLDIKTTLTRQLDIENPSNQTFGKTTAVRSTQRPVRNY